MRMLVGCNHGNISHSYLPFHMIWTQQDIWSWRNENILHQRKKKLLWSIKDFLHKKKKWNPVCAGLEVEGLEVEVICHLCLHTIICRVLRIYCICSSDTLLVYNCSFFLLCQTRLTADKSMRLLLSTFSSLREELLQMSEDLRVRALNISLCSAEHKYLNPERLIGVC